MEVLMHLYDQLVPKSLKKVAALFNFHNGWATINTRTPTGRIAMVGPTEWQVQDGNHRTLTPPLKNKDVALFYLNEGTVQKRCVLGTSRRAYANRKTAII